MTSRIAFISLEPDERLSSLVSDYKRRVRKLVGDQLYLTDPPHTTLYLAAFSNLNQVAKTLFNLASELQPITVSLDGWHVFHNDALTGNHTLVCHWSEAAQRAARTVQAAVIERISPLRDTKATQARFASRWESLSPLQQQSVTKQGFPFTGEAWHPHLTIASIRPADWDASYGVLCQDPPQLSGLAMGLKLYELSGIHPKPILSVPFSPQTMAA